MLTKTQIKLIKSLTQKKNRQHHGMFVVEGVKSIMEFLQAPYYKLIQLYTLKDQFNTPKEQTTLILAPQLSAISNLKNPNMALALFEILDRPYTETEGLSIGLENISDPGNMGTIIRLCDWFGVTQLICSPNTVDCYNPKVVQASMGSLARVGVYYKDLNTFLNKINKPTYGTFLEGENIYKATLYEKAFILFGNEANGLSKEIEKTIENKITIPQFGAKAATESLNVANACAVVLSEFLRRTITEKKS